jgi:hypothetical protein
MISALSLSACARLGNDCRVSESRRGRDTRCDQSRRRRRRGGHLDPGCGGRGVIRSVLGLLLALTAVGMTACTGSSGRPVKVNRPVPTSRATASAPSQSGQAPTTAAGICRQHFADTSIAVSTTLAAALHAGTETKAAECLVPTAPGYWDADLIVATTGEIIYASTQTFGNVIEPRP